ncbi:MAG: flagellar basal body-associated FliL family protein [Betaproteobacteria bacterium]|nr:flagellar basal body-associated FliL family protein [Betaproteobacteria bacterium]
MAEEAVVEEGAEQKPKSKLIPIILGAVGLIVIVAGTMLATLYFTGFFKPKPPTLTAEERIALGLDPDPEAAAKGGEKGKDGKDAKPEKLKKSPEAQRFDFNYFQMEREFLVNITGSKRVMSIQVAVMTRYDQRVVDNIKKHEFALRSAMMDVMRQSQESDINKPEFRVELAKKLRDAMNSLLEKYEEFGGVEDVFFTSFIIQ